MRHRERWSLVAVGLLSLTAFAIGATHLDTQSMWRDEVDAIRFAGARLSELVANFTRPGWNGPLYFLLLRGWIHATGSGAYSVRLFSLLFGVLCVPLTYAAGRRILNHRTATVAAALTASVPYLAWYSVEAKMYTWVTALSILAVYALRRTFDEPAWKWWAVQIVATSLAAYSHIIAALLIPVQAIMYVAWGPRTRRQWTGAVVSAALLLLPYLPLLAWQAPLLLVSRRTGFASASVGQIMATLVTGWSIGPYPPRDWLHALSRALVGLAAWALTLTALLVLIRRFRTRLHKAKARAVVSLAGWTVLPAVALGVISRWQPIFTDRYLIWCSPAFYLLVALGLSSVGDVWKLGRHFVTPLTILVVAVNLVSSQLQLSGTRKADFRAVAAFIAGYENSPKELGTFGAPSALPVRRFLPIVLTKSSGASQGSDLIMFQIPHARHAFEYYYEGPEYMPADGPFTNHRTADNSYLVSGQDVSVSMAHATEGYDTVWLVATEADAWDDRGLTELWLAENLRLELIAHFAHIDVHRYSRAPTARSP